MTGQDIRIEPYAIDVSGEVIADLGACLPGTRWPPPLPVEGWRTGTEPVYLRELTRYRHDALAAAR